METSILNAVRDCLVFSNLSLLRVINNFGNSYTLRSIFQCLFARAIRADFTKICNSSNRVVPILNRRVLSVHYIQLHCYDALFSFKGARKTTKSGSTVARRTIRRSSQMSRNSGQPLRRSLRTIGIEPCSIQDFQFIGPNSSSCNRFVPFVGYFRILGATTRLS